MRAVVFAYHNMGVLGIRKLVRHGFEIPLVLTHADSASENIWFGSVADLCRSLSLECGSPDDPNTPGWVERIRGLRPDIMFSFYYRSMLGKEILDLAPLGAYNLHGSLLPAYRGRCPVNWVIIRGEEYTGVTLHEMVEKPDAGPIVAQERVPIDAEDTPLSLFAKLEGTASRMLDGILPRIRNRDIPRVPQDLGKGSYFGGRKPDDGRICWEKEAGEIFNLVRGVTRPYPGAFGYLGGGKVVFWRAGVREGIQLSPGLIFYADRSVLIGTGRDALHPLEVEVDGRIMRDRDMERYFMPYQGEYMT